MGWRPVILTAFLMLVASAAWAQVAEGPSVIWLDDDLNVVLRDGSTLDFAFQYEVHLSGGADPEGDAILELTVCENRRCFTQALAVVEGTSFQRYGLDPSRYHLGRNLFTLTLTLTDNGMTSSDWLKIEARVRR